MTKGKLKKKKKSFPVLRFWLEKDMTAPTWHLLKMPGAVGILATRNTV